MSGIAIFRCKHDQNFSSNDVYQTKNSVRRLREKIQTHGLVEEPPFEIRRLETVEVDFHFCKMILNNIFLRRIDASIFEARSQRPDDIPRRHYVGSFACHRLNVILVFFLYPFLLF